MTDRPLDDGVKLFEIEQERGQDLREPLAKKVIEKGYASAGWTCGGRTWRPCTRTWC